MSVAQSASDAALSLGLLEALLRLWWRLLPIERDGRVYELLGFRPVFSLVARMFGETLPPPARCGPGDTAAWTTDHLRLVRVRTRYHELVNLISVTIYLVLIVVTALTPHRLLLAYAVILASTHAVSILLERYKRARCEAILRSRDEPADAPPLDTVADATPVAAASASAAPAAGWWFRPRPFETDRFYAIVGVNGFRRFIFWLIRASLPPATERKRHSRFLENGGAGLVSFEAQTRVSEATHLFGALLHAPFVVAFARDGYWIGVAYVVYMLYMNLYSALLQRAHRARLWRVMTRRSRGR